MRMCTCVQTPAAPPGLVVCVATMYRVVLRLLSGAVRPVSVCVTDRKADATGHPSSSSRVKVEPKYWECEHCQSARRLTFTARVSVVHGDVDVDAPLSCMATRPAAVRAQLSPRRSAPF